MRRFLASPRRRRRAVWVGAVLLAVGGAVTLGVMYPNTGRDIEAPRTGGPIQVYKDPVPERLTRDDRARAFETALRFVNTAVARKHTADSYDLVSPLLKEGLTRRQWAAGEIPVQPYPAAEARVRIDYSFHNQLGLKMMLLPPSKSAERPVVFNMDLVAVGKGTSRRWLVNEFTPATTQPVPAQTAGASSALGGGNGLAPNTEGLESPIGAAWLIVPVALLGSVLLIPIGLGIRSWRQNRRAYRNYASRPLDV